MEDAQNQQETSRPTTVQQDWIAWLPEEKSCLFETTSDELEISYNILSVALDNAFTFCDQGKLVPAREQGSMFSDLFDRLTEQLRGVLRSLDEHGRQFGTQSRVAPLRADLFRSGCAHTVVRTDHWLSLVSLRRPGHFFRKLAVLDNLLIKLQAQMREIATEIGEGATLSLPCRWTHLEVLHHDLNTCFCETMIMMKSFLCAMPSGELLPFRKRLLSLVPTAATVHPRRPARFVTKIPSAYAPQPAEVPAPAARSRQRHLLR